MCDIAYGSGDYAAHARRVQRFTLRQFADFGGAAHCASAGAVSYRRSDAEPEWSDLWYQTTQIAADTALLAAGGGSEDRCLVEKAGRFLDRFWDGETGGYLARGRPDGSLFLRPDKYCDDHGHLGLVMLETWRVTGDARWLERARRAADFLMHGEVWDSTFGGGFWWCTLRGAVLEGKPAQANGLATALFYGLFEATEEPAYLRWAERTVDWLEKKLYDRAAGLYRWSRHHGDLERRRGEVLNERFFNYDQGILIEAWLARYRHSGDRVALERALGLAERLEGAFWQREVGGFSLVSGVPEVLTIYSAWLTPSLLALYEVDSDPRWLSLARRNVEALGNRLGTPEGGSFKGARLEAGTVRIDRTLDQVSNSGTQWALARLASARGDLR